MKLDPRMAEDYNRAIESGQGATFLKKNSLINDREENFMSYVKDNKYYGLSNFKHFKR